MSAGDGRLLQRRRGLVRHGVTEDRRRKPISSCANIQHRCDRDSETELKRPVVTSNRRHSGARCARWDLRTWCPGSALFRHDLAKAAAWFLSPLRGQEKPQGEK
jgi:hypothetical protein